MDRYQQLEEVRRKWTPPKELTGSVPREIRLSSGGYVVAVLAVLLILGGIGAGIALSAVGRREAAVQMKLAREGQEAEARVTRVWRASDKEHVPMVAYQFEVDGRQYGDNVKVPLRIWKLLAVGSPLAVRFLPADPLISHPLDWRKERMPVWAPFLVGSMFSGIGVGLVFLLKREAGLLSEGRPAPAIVTKYSHGQHGSKNVHYEFRLLSGSLAKGKSGPTRKLPAIGATICVLYDRDNPRRNRAYPFEMVRVANASK